MKARTRAFDDLHLYRQRLIKDVTAKIEEGENRVLLVGSSGSGKTFCSEAILAAVCDEYNKVSGVDAYGPVERQSVHHLQMLMRGIVLLEGLEAFSMKVTGRDLRLLNIMEDLLQTPDLVIATARNLSAIDPSLKRQFKTIFTLSPLDLEERRILFETAETHWPVVMQYRQLPDTDKEAFLAKFSGLQPSEIFLSPPLDSLKTFEKVAGMAPLLTKLDTIVVKSLTQPSIFRAIGAKPPRGVLLTGPPGCGKTLIARSLGEASRVSFFSVQSTDIIAKEVGESEKRLHEIFEKARASAPSLILFDDIDSIAGKRTFGTTGSDASDRLLTTLLVETDGLAGRDDGVVVIGTTSRPQTLDPAITRPGRFDYILEIPLPDKEDRGMMFDMFTKDIPIENRETVRNMIITKLEGKTGADILGVIREAAMSTLRADLTSQKVSAESFLQSINSLNKSEDVPKKQPRNAFAKQTNKPWIKKASVK